MKFIILYSLSPILNAYFSFSSLFYRLKLIVPLLNLYYFWSIFFQVYSPQFQNTSLISLWESETINNVDKTSRIKKLQLCANNIHLQKGARFRGLQVGQWPLNSTNLVPQIWFKIQYNPFPLIDLCCKPIDGTDRSKSEYYSIFILSRLKSHASGGCLLIVGTSLGGVFLTRRNQLPKEW